MFNTVCLDIDECETSTDNCDELATCTNRVGSFTCECPAGYNGFDGVTCTGKFLYLKCLI